MKDVTFFKEIPVELNETVLQDRLKLRERLRSSKDFQWAVEQARNLIHPRGIVGIAHVSSKNETTLKIDTEIFTSKILRVNLDSCDEVYPFLVTIGQELENLAAQQTSLTKKFFLEIIGDFSLTNAMWYIESKIKENNSLKRISSMSPGSLENWGIKQQIPLFKLFNKEAEQLGVNLTPSMLMKPRKSLSGIAFQTTKSFISCQLCPRDRCPGRRAKYSPEKFAEYDLPIPK